MTAVNSHNVPVGESGHILCQFCGKEVTEISKDVTIEFAYCPDHLPRTEPKKTREKKKGQVPTAQEEVGQTKQSTITQPQPTEEDMSAMASPKQSTRKAASPRKPTPKPKRAKGKADGIINWFREKAAEQKDVVLLRRSAKAADYSDSTITTQIGRLRAVSLLKSARAAKAEKKED